MMMVSRQWRVIIKVSIFDLLMWNRKQNLIHEQISRLNHLLLTNLILKQLRRKSTLLLLRQSASSSPLLRTFTTKHWLFSFRFFFFSQMFAKLSHLLIMEYFSWYNTRRRMKLIFVRRVGTFELILCTWKKVSSLFLL